MLYLFWLYWLFLILLILIEHGILLQIWPTIESLRKVYLSLCNFRATGQLVKSGSIPGLVKRNGLTDGFLIGSFFLGVLDFAKVNAIGPQGFNLLHQRLFIIGTTQYFL